jgi:hypothetical protein
LIKQLKEAYDNNVPLKIGSSAYTVKNRELLEAKKKLSSDNHLKQIGEKADFVRSKFALQDYLPKKLVEMKVQAEGNMPMNQLVKKEGRIKNFKKQGREKEEKQLRVVNEKMKLPKSVRHTRTKYMGKQKTARRILIHKMQNNPKLGRYQRPKSSVKTARRYAKKK